MKRSTDSDPARRHRRGFTLVELILAGAIAALVLITVVTTLSQVGRARTISRARLQAHLRADAALNAVRRDLTSVLRDADLFHARVLLYDGSTVAMVGGDRLDFARDEILVFNGRLEPLGEIDYNGEGGEYETQYRIDEDNFGLALWQRRDAVPDEWPDGGGIATPIAEGLVALEIRAYDGQEWYEEWDSDLDGLPWGFQISVTAIGTDDGSLAEADPSTMATLRTHVAVDRIVPPWIEPEEEETTPADGLSGDDEMIDGAFGVPAPPGGGQGDREGGLPNRDGGGGRGAERGGDGGGGRGGSFGGGGNKPSGGVRGDGQFSVGRGSKTIRINTGANQLD
jgi:type II secretion system protein J